MNTLQDTVNQIDENNLALRNAIVAFDNVCNSQKEANRLLGLMLDIFEARFDMNRDEFHPDELEDYVSGAKFLRRFGRGNGRINEAEDIIEKQ